jgi:hypothetical protein
VKKLRMGIARQQITCRFPGDGRDPFVRTR